MSSGSDNNLQLAISFRGNTHKLSISPETTLLELQTQLEELTAVPPSLQKLLYKGKKTARDDAESVTLLQIGLKNGTKIQMLGSTTQELGGLQSVEDERRKRERIMRERAMKAPVKVRSTGAGVFNEYRFHEVQPLEHLPNPSSARALLTKLAEDPAIKHIMQQHKFTVGLLTELAPHEQPHLLGLNTGKGLNIKLRIRTDRYDGFRLYKEIRRVLCHELTHNVWGDHDNNFKELNSQLNREVTEYERSVAAGTHYLGGNTGDVYQPDMTSELEAEAQQFVLGGHGQSIPILPDESIEERRRRVLEATINRLKREEEEIEHSCGTGSSAT
ncbi:WLM domain-containing protein [Cyathus striatus]|nr:WLM domain-containing protein [Cyathus striatus]